MKIIFFDWNGTLLDDTPLVLDAVREIFTHYNLSVPTPEEWFRELDRDALRIYQNRGITATLDELNRIYEPFYESHLQEIFLFLGADIVLRLCAQKNLPVGLLTLQQESLVAPFLSRYNLEAAFRYREFQCTKKDTVMKRICEEQGIPLSECYFIGDSPSDMRHARRAGVNGVAFLGGHVPESLFTGDAEPAHTVRNFGGLMTFINSRA